MKHNNRQKLLTTFYFVIPNLSILAIQILSLVKLPKPIGIIIGLILLLPMYIGMMYYMPASLIFGYGPDKFFAGEDGYIFPTSILVSLLFTIAYGIIFYGAISFYFKKKNQ
jgi:hypothetical protein